MTPGSDWAGRVLHLFRGIERMERLTAFLFAGASLPEEQGGQAVAKLLAPLTRSSRSLRDWLTMEVAQTDRIPRL